MIVLVIKALWRGVFTALIVWGFWTLTGNPFPHHLTIAVIYVGLIYAVAWYRGVRDVLHEFRRMQKKYTSLFDKARKNGEATDGKLTIKILPDSENES